MEFDTNTLAGFIVRAKKACYAGGGREVEPQVPGFKEFEYVEGDWNYRDSYFGYYFVPGGREIVKFKGQAVWIMAYNGGMKPECRWNEDFARQTFSFLKKALSLVQASRPFKGPMKFADGDWRYSDGSRGNISNFNGSEKIVHDNSEVFKQDYFGGIVVPKRDIVTASAVA